MKRFCQFNKYIFVNFISFFILVSGASAETLSQDQWRRMATLHGVATKAGLDIPSMYVFFDPNCPWSAKLYNNNIDGKLFGERDAIWLPVHYMRQDSFGMAAALLREGREALHSNFSSFDFSKQRGSGIAINPDDQEFKELQKIDKAWREMSGILGTPVIVYKNKAGTVQMQLGFPPRSMMEEIIDGLPSARLQNYDATGS